MGCYIEPPLDPNPSPDGKDRTLARVRWLTDHALPLRDAPGWPLPTGLTALVAVENPTFLAVGVAYSERELFRFVRGMADRQHQWFVAAEAEVIKVSPLAAYLSEPDD